MIVRALRSLRNKIERVLDAQNAPPELLATDMCMPIPGARADGRVKSGVRVAAR